jgi:phage terminase small subunit
MRFRRRLHTQILRKSGMTVPDDELTPKQRRFVAEYLKDHVGAKAAARAGYSAETAKQQAARLLTNVDVKRAVEAGERAEGAADDAYKARVHRANRAIVEADPRQFFDDQGSIKPLKDWTPEMAAAVASAEVVIKNAKAGDGMTDGC